MNNTMGRGHTAVQHLTEVWLVSSPRGGESPVKASSIFAKWNVKSTRKT